MTRFIKIIGLVLLFSNTVYGQAIIPLDTAHWKIEAQGQVFEQVDGQNAIYLSNGSIILKDRQFVNGTVEYDIRMTNRRGFYGLRFRITEDGNAEEFYFRPHQSGNPDANQATPVVNGLAGWQLYFGPAYSVPYDYPFDRWMHVKIVVKEMGAQLYLDGAMHPSLSWRLKQKPGAGPLALTSNLAPIHYANFSVQPGVGELVDFSVKEQPRIKGIVEKWQVSDKFEEKALNDLEGLEQLIATRSWNNEVHVEENNAANLAWAARRHDGTDQNTVFARITIQATSEMIKLFHFGYSDRIVAILNGKPIYKGTNQFRSRDYRYLGTIGLFDAIFLPLEKGTNSLLLAVSEDFGGWGVTGKFADREGIVVVE